VPILIGRIFNDNFRFKVVFSRKLHLIRLRENRLKLFINIYLSKNNVYQVISIYIKDGKSFFDKYQLKKYFICGNYINKILTHICFV